MKPTPMTAFHSAPPSSRVGMPKGEAKTPAYLARLRAMVAAGQSPIAAMIAIERGDGHAGRTPPNPQPENVGGRGTPRPGRPTPAADRIMEHMTPEWQSITPELCAAVNAHHETIRMSMKRLVSSGLVECKRGNGSTPSMWRTL